MGNNGIDVPRHDPAPVLRARPVLRRLGPRFPLSHRMVLPIGTRAMASVAALRHHRLVRPFASQRTGVGLPVGLSSDRCVVVAALLRMARTGSRLSDRQLGRLLHHCTSLPSIAGGPQLASTYRFSNNGRSGGPSLCRRTAWIHRDEHSSSIARGARLVLRSLGNFRADFEFQASIPLEL